MIMRHKVTKVVIVFVRFRALKRNEDSLEFLEEQNKETQTSTQTVSPIQLNFGTKQNTSGSEDTPRIGHGQCFM
jgi:hypothetical protein